MRDPARARVKLHALGEDVGETLEEIRELAHGVYPSLLADRGLAEALRGVSLSSPIASRLRTDPSGGIPRRWRAPSTSAAWRRSRTPRNTPPARACSRSRSGRTTPCSSRSATTAPVPLARGRGRRVDQHARQAGRCRRRARDQLRAERGHGRHRQGPARPRLSGCAPPPRVGCAGPCVAGKPHCATPRPRPPYGSGKAARPRKEPHE